MNDGYYNTLNSEITTDPATSAAVTGGAMFVIFFVLIIALAAYVIMALLLGRIFKKAGVEGAAWKAWVPIYNNWILLELGGQKGFWAALAIIPVVNIVSAVFMIIAMYHIGLKFGKDGAFVLLAIFLPIVWFAWLALDKSTWNGAPIAAAASTATSANNSFTPNASTDSSPSTDNNTDNSSSNDSSSGGGSDSSSSSGGSDGGGSSS